MCHLIVATCISNMKSNFFQIVRSFSWKIELVMLYLDRLAFTAIQSMLFDIIYSFNESKTINKWIKTNSLPVPN